jgi:tetratricopeptide (TPR) repeat protein
VTPNDDQVRTQLARILASARFAKAEEQRRFLEYVVAERLAGRHSGLCEKSIGCALEGRRPFKPLETAAIRQRAHDVRERLAHYYRNAGRHDVVEIGVPKGGYVPSFSYRLSRRSALQSGTFAGRSAELSRLEALRQGVADGRGALVLIGGDAGIGKTALMERFTYSSSADDGPCVVLHGRCSQRLYEGYPFAPFLDALDGLVRDPRLVWGKALLQQHAPRWWRLVASHDDESAPSNGTPDSFEQLRRELTALFHALSLDQPFLLLLDDLHWADASSCDLLAHLADRAREMRLLVIATYRSGESVDDRRPFSALKVDLTRRECCEQIVLGALDLAEVRAVLANVLGSPVASPLVEAVHRRTEGHPLFLTDLCRIGKASGAFGRGAQSRNTAIEFVNTTIPSNTLDMIRLALRRLSDVEHQILEYAALQGRDFEADVVARALGLEIVQVEGLLRKLQTTERLLECRGEQSFPDGTRTSRYRFAHSFYQDVLLSDVLPSRRRTSSLGVARVLVALRRDETATQAASLGELFEAGGGFDEAARMFGVAARGVTSVSAYREAVFLAERARHLLLLTPEGPERDSREVDLLMIAGVGHMVTGGFTSPDAERVHRRARVLCERSGDTFRLATVLWRLHTHELNSGRLLSAHELAKDMRRVTTQIDSAASNIQSLHALGTTLSFIGRFDEARPLLERILEMAGSSPSEAPRSPFVIDPVVTTSSLLARLCVITGCLSEAESRAAASLRRAETLDHPHSVAYAAFWMGAVEHCRSMPEAALPHLRRAIRLSRAHRLPQIRAWATFLHGSAMSQSCGGVGGIRAMRSGLEKLERMGCLIERPFCLTLLAAAHLEQAHVRKSLELCEEANDVARSSGALCHLAETLRVKALTRLKMRAPRRIVATELAQALAAAQEVGARMLELRVAIDIAKLGEPVNHTQPRFILERVVRSFSTEDVSPLLTTARRLLGSASPQPAWRPAATTGRV